MYPFRSSTPKHRKNRTVCLNYKSYKGTLRIDFIKRCGYCNALDARFRNYTIDHFVPQNPDGWTHTIPPNKYINLIYACSLCNGAKSNKWPTRNARIDNNGTVGFIKPTKKKYGDLFRRDVDGSIKVHANQAIGVYIHKELNFDLAVHALNWKFETFLEQEKKLEKIFATTNDSVIKEKIKTLKLLRLEIYDTISEIYNA